MSSFKTPPELYKACPELQDIKERLANSEIEKKALNEKNQQNYTQGTGRPPRVVYPEHFAITEFLKDGQWTKTAATPKSGGEAFEAALVQMCERKEPQGLKIAVYPGKRESREVLSMTVYLNETAKTEHQNTGALGTPVDIALEKLREEMKTMFPEQPKSDVSLASIQATFNAQFKEIEHSTALEKVNREWEQKMVEKNREIADLQDEVEQLQIDLAASDAELGTTADIINEKLKKPTLVTLLGAGIEEGLTNLVLHRPKILTDIFKLKPDQVQEIFAEHKPQIAGPAAQSNSATFTEVATTDEYEGYEAKHKEVLIYVKDTVKALPVENFRLFYTICMFLFTDDGKLDVEHANQLIGYIHLLEEREKEANKNQQQP